MIIARHRPVVTRIVEGQCKGLDKLSEDARILGYHFMGSRALVDAHPGIHRSPRGVQLIKSYNERVFINISQPE